MFSTVNCGKNTSRPATQVPSPAITKKGLMVLSIKLFMDSLLIIVWLKRLAFGALNKIYILCCCFLWFFHHGRMAAIFDDYSLMIFQSLFKNWYAGNINDFILIAPKD